MLLSAIDRVIAVIAGFIVLFDGNIDILLVAAVLTSAVVGGLGVYIDDKRYMYALIAAYLMAMLKFPVFLSGIPLVSYEFSDILLKYCYNIRSKEWEPLKVVCQVGLLVLIVAVTAHAANTFSPHLIAKIVVLSLVSMVVCIYNNLYVTTKQTLIETVDNSHELNMALSAKNHYLIEKQNTEINLATLSERNRIAREIHDNVGHMLSRSILQIGAAMAINKDETMALLLTGIKDTLDSAMNSIRSSVHDLHETSVDLENSMQEIVDSLTSFKVDYEYDIEGDVPKNVKYCLISITKEAASNIIKYCNGDSVQIVLREHPAFYQLFIKDNGTRISNIDDTEGIGLVGMRERVNAFGGTISINTRKGFSIFINIPKYNKGGEE